MSTAIERAVREIKANPEQWEAFKAESHCVVLAPPGSGKTKLLATRFFADVTFDIGAPHGAACVTLTNNAADEISRRLTTLGLRLRPNIFVGTVHSFALNCIVRPFARFYCPDILRRKIAKKLDIDAAYSKVLPGVYPVRTRKRTRSTIEVYRRRFMPESMWARIPQIRQARDQYMDALSTQGLVDFDEIIATAVQMVEDHPVVRRVLNARFRSIHIDEYQDLAPGLDRIVKALCLTADADARFFAVGDPDQSIYGWTGSRPELLDELSRLPGVHPVYLRRNYRCRLGIIRVAEHLRSPNVRTPMWGDQTGGTVTPVLCPGGLADQAHKVALAVHSWHKAGEPFHEIAAIAPTKVDCEQVERELQGIGVPAFLRTDDYGLTASTSLIEDAAAWATQGRQASEHRLGEILSRWRLCLASRWDRNKSVGLTDLLLRVNGKASGSDFVNLLSGMGLASAETDELKTEDQEELKRMADAFKDGGALSSLSVAELGNRARRRGRVEVLTMSASKGLEFNRVCIVGLDQKKIPFAYSIDDEDKLGEERRKVYVAITRARIEVHCYYSGFIVWPKSNERDPAGPSQFLFDMGIVDRAAWRATVRTVR